MNHSITFQFPLERPHCGVPLANGNFGALVWGNNTLCVTINQNDLWNHFGGQLLDEQSSYAAICAHAEKYGCDYAMNKITMRAGETIRHPDHTVCCRPHRMPVGRFEFSFSDAVKPKEAELDYDSGKLTVRLSNGAEITLIIVLKVNRLYLEDPSGAIGGVILKPASDFPKTRQFFEEFNLAPYKRLADGWVITLPEDPDYTIRAVKTAYGYKIFANSAEDDSQKTEECRFTARWWHETMLKAARVTTPDPWWNRFYDFNVYKLAAATVPFGYPSGLQGPWHEEYQNCQWGGDFHFNVNVQMIYGPLCRLGLPEHLLPLFDMIESEPFQRCMRHNAKMLFGVDDALWQTHAVDDRGAQVGWLSIGAVLDPACGAWTALLYEEYFKTTGDLDFLRNRAWPYVYGIMRSYEEMLDENFNIPVAISAEYASSNKNMSVIAGRNPSYQLAAIRRLAAMLIEFAGLLNKTERPIWRQILDKIPHFTTVSGYDSYGQKDEARIAIWEGQDLAVCHRHHSHLGAIWPFDTLPEKLDPENAQIVNNSIDHWIDMGIGKWSEWGIPWANIIYTRMGLQEAPMELFAIWRNLFVNEGLCTVYLPRHLSLIAHRRHDIAKPKDENELMQLDGCGGFLDAFLQMCAYQKEGKLHLFCGMPAQWKEIEVRNLLLPGGIRLTADRSGKILYEK